MSDMPVHVKTTKILQKTISKNASWYLHTILILARKYISVLDTVKRYFKKSLEFFCGF